ncbi:EamA family transporter [Chloroflexota bacterium]
MGAFSVSILLALGASVAYGAADFSGGLVSKRTSSLGVVLLGHAFSLLFLLPLALLLGEPFPTLPNLLFGMLAGLSGGFGLIILYKALAEGQMSLASPVSALVAAALPVLVGLWLDGLPGPLMLLGFTLALLAIWLIANTGTISLSNVYKQLRLPFISGIFFGLFFIGMNRASGDAVIWPIIATRLGSIPGLLIYSTIVRLKWMPAGRNWSRILLVSLLDTLGNICFIFSSQLGRLDLAAVISSLYPASTVALAWLVLKERMIASQWLGVLCALLALVFISL